MASTAALLSVLLVHLFNWVGINFLTWSKTHEIGFLELFLNYEWFFLVVPLMGIAIGSLFKKITVCFSGPRTFIFQCSCLGFFMFAGLEPASG
jgi:hypothetical protein